MAAGQRRQSNTTIIERKRKSRWNGSRNRDGEKLPCTSLVGFLFDSAAESEWNGDPGCNRTTRHCSGNVLSFHYGFDYRIIEYDV